MVREGYKITELGEIPEDWNIEKLGELGEFKNGINKSKEDFGFGTLFVNIQDVYRSTVVKESNLERLNANEKETELYQLKYGDIVLVRSSVKPEGVGFPILFEFSNEKVVYCGFTIRFSYDQKKLVPKYLLYLLRSDKIRNMVTNASTVSANTNINQKQYSNITIAFPKLNEQQKIADILSTVDEQLEQTHQLIEKTKELKKGLMQKLLTTGIGHTAFKQTEVGEIPIEWELMELNKISNLGKVKFDPKKDSKQHKYIGLEHIESSIGEINGFGYSTDTTSTKSVFNTGDILFGKLRPYLKKYWYASFDGVCSTEILVIKAKQNPKFLFYLIQQECFIEFTTSKSFGTKMPRASWDTMKEYKFPIPTIKEQQKIADFLSSVDDQLEEYNTKKQKLEILKKGLMQQLLTGKFRVNV